MWRFSSMIQAQRFVTVHAAVLFLDGVYAYYDNRPLAICFQVQQLEV